MRTLASGSLLPPSYKDTRVVILSEARQRAERRTCFCDLGQQGAVYTKESAGGSRPQSSLITLEQTDACDYRCRCSRCSRCAGGVGVWKFDESRELLRQQRSERQCQYNQLE